MLIHKQVDFSYGHQLIRHRGKCVNEHGHNARLIVAVDGALKADANQSDFGMVEDFGWVKDEIKRVIVDRFDHKFLAEGWERPCIALMMAKQMRQLLEDDLIPPGFGATLQAFDIAKAEVNNVVLGFPTTAECLVVYTFAELKKALEPRVTLEYVTWFETDTSAATCFRPDFDANDHKYADLGGYFEALRQEAAMNRGG